MPPAGRPDPGRPDPGKLDPGKQPGTGLPVPGPQAAEPTAGKPFPEKKADSGVRWTLQLVSTPDPDEAQRMAAKSRAAGFPAAVVPDKGLYKVRLTPPAAREAVDATALKLKNRGFKPFAIKVE